MAQISASDVGKLRSLTGAGLMKCKQALGETNGDVEAAIDLLRKKGEADSEKKSSRTANEGVIAQYVGPGAKVGLLVEINCETDFVARNEAFREFCDGVAEKLAANPDVDLEDSRTAQVTKMGENIQISRHQRLEIEGNGMIAAYIHTGAKVGVLVEVGAGKAETASNDDFKQLVKDITLQVAAAHPSVVSREQLDPTVVEKEKDIAREQMKDKPPQALEKIIAGKLEKFYQGCCLVDQGFVKRNSEVTVKEHVAQTAKDLGDEITIRRFLRFQVGES